MKRIISIIAVIAMLFTLTAIFASCGGGQSVPDSVVNKAIDSSEKVKWSYDNSTYTLSIVGDKENPVPMFEKAPKSADDIPWKSIRNYVAKIEIVGVTDIPDYAFYSMVSLKSVNFGDSITSIGKCAFAFCSVLSLADVKKADSSAPLILPEGIKTIGESAFEGCTSLTEIELPSTVEEVGDKAFAYNYNLKKIIKPEDLKLPENALDILSGNTVKTNTSVKIEALKDKVEEPEDEETTAPDEDETEAPNKDETEAQTDSDSKDEEEKPDMTTTIIAISIIAVVIVGVIIGAVLLMRSNKKQSKDARTVRKNDDQKVNKSNKNTKNGKNTKKGKKK